MTLLIFSAFVRVLSLTIVRMTSSWGITTLIDSVENLVSVRMFLTSIIFLRRKQYCVVTTCSHAMEQDLKYYFLGDVIHSREIPLVHVMKSGPRCSFSRLAIHMPDEDKLGSKPKLKIIYSGKPLEHFVQSKEDGSSHVKIPRPSNTHPRNPYSKHCSITIVCDPSTEKVIKLPPYGTENIMDILDAKPNPTECIGKSNDVHFKEELAHVPLPSRSQYFPSIGRKPLDGLKGVRSPNDDKVESIHRANAPSLAPRPQHPLRALQRGISVFNVDAVIKEVDKSATWAFDKTIPDKVSRTLFDGLPSLKGNLYATILQRGADVTPLESNVEGLIKQACDFRDLYSGQTSTEEHDSCRMEVQGKLDEASCRLNTGRAHYNAKVDELKQVEFRRKEQRKELQLLGNQKKDLSLSEHSLQETEREVIDLQGQTDILNAIEVMDAAIKPSLEKTKAYIKESFEDLKNFQWNPEHSLQETEREVIDLQGQLDILIATEVMDAATKASLEKTKAYIKESFEDLKNVSANEHSLQETEREVIDLQGQLDILNATEVMDAATKASLAKTKAYIKESFKDLKNVQWNP
ncbi:LOW QUALITY PROTEIN: hypothetical protein Cgig2_003650 [Carnegiea gigantea]|uniref:Uncharacterized protein n=1 Tax=Carnegiea gigantea TaxID=171969 RepID=A0A9Q1JHF1_9CARY|nr:LOW QUALITY PROTEIN: hypothetical protein Cgig2_003650 [Carnegiea gigantea]